MDGTHLHLSVTTFLSFLVLILLQASVPAQSDCSVPEPLYEIEENNEVNALVATITLQDGATVSLAPPEGPDNPFRLSDDGTQLLAAAVLDYENDKNITFYNVGLMCHLPSASSSSPFSIGVLVKNVNDNAPWFQQEVYKFNVNELSPTNTALGRINANDADKLSLYYRLDGETDGFFKLQSPTVPLILVETPPNYDKVKNVSLTLYVQDTPLTPPSITPSHNATTIVEITILDVDNRPPWFQPCTKHVFGDNVICTSSGYTGRVTLNKKEPGFLKLNPGPLYAIDGDDGIKDEITYSILGGNDLFEIDNSTGNMTMQKEATTLGTITLTVLAAQKSNNFQATSTSVIISVVSENLHPPKFQNDLYRGTVTGVGNVALDMKNEPLQFIVMDADYAATGGLNPNVIYSIKDQSNFSIIGGYLFMTKDLPAATLNLTVEARDTSNGDTAKADLQLEVKSAPILTTPVPTLSTTAGSISSPSSNTPPEGTGPTVTPTKPTDTTVGTGPTPTPSGTTTKPTGTTDGTGLTPTPSGTTTKPTGTTDGTGPTPTPSGTTTKPTGTTDGNGPTPTPSGTTTKPTGTTDGTGPTTTPSGTTTKPTDTTDGTGPTPTPSGITKPTDTTDGTGPTPTPSGITKPTDTTDGTGPTPTPSWITKPTVTTDSTGPTRTPSGTTTNPSGATFEPSQTSNGSVPTVNTPQPPKGGYGPGDMAALGATLGILLCGCLVVIAFLLFRIRRDKGDWKKIYETNKFRSNLNNGFGGEKEGIQYANHGFMNDEDASSTRSSSSDGGSEKALKLPITTAEDLERYVTPKEISALAQNDTASQSGSDSDDKEKEVKPILTKGRRQDDGYKSVWFKEDISPEAEEVVIIPDSRENDTDEEEQEQTNGNREENGRGNSDTKRPKTRVGFKDDKSNSGGEDSQDDKVLAINL